MTRPADESGPDQTPIERGMADMNRWSRKNRQRTLPQPNAGRRPAVYAANRRLTFQGRID